MSCQHQIPLQKHSHTVMFKAKPRANAKIHGLLWACQDSVKQQHDSRHGRITGRLPSHCYILLIILANNYATLKQICRTAARVLFHKVVYPSVAGCCAPCFLRLHGIILLKIHCYCHSQSNRQSQEIKIPFPECGQSLSTSAIDKPQILQTWPLIFYLGTCRKLYKEHE